MSHATRVASKALEWSRRRGTGALLAPALAIALCLQLTPTGAAADSPWSAIDGNVTWQPQFKTFNGVYQEKKSNMAALAAWSGSYGLTVGVATKGSSPRSLFNQWFPPDGNDLDVEFQMHTLQLQHSMGAVGVRLGRLENTLWLPSDFLWDSDIHPWGGALSVTRGHWKAEVGGFELQDAEFDEWQRTMLVVQAQTRRELGAGLRWTTTAGWAPVLDVEGENLRFSAGTNTRDAGGLAEGFAPLFANSSVDASDSHRKRSVFVEGNYNPAAESDNLGFSAGITYGAAQLTGWEDWRLQVFYRWLQPDAWLDTLPDVSAFNGRTGVRGFEVIYIHGVTSWLRLDVDAYWMIAETPAGDATYFYVQFKNKILF